MGDPRQLIHEAINLEAKADERRREAVRLRTIATEEEAAADRMYDAAGDYRRWVAKRGALSPNLAALTARLADDLHLPQTCREQYLDAAVQNFLAGIGALPAGIVERARDLASAVETFVNCESGGTYIPWFDVLTKKVNYGKWKTLKEAFDNFRVGDAPAIREIAEGEGLA